MQTLLSSIENFLLKQGIEQKYLIAFSGGLDSAVLLHLLYTLRTRYPLKLQAIHIHHGLSPNADAWQLQCEKQCAEYTIPYSYFKVNAQPQAGASPENIARQARYKILAENLNSNNILLTAHHQDDQAETVLLQLFRGAGLKGLAAMPAIKSFANGFHARPLLNFPRQTLQAYAQAQQVTWVDDESNLNTDYTRNFIRHEVLSLLKSRWPSVNESLARVALHCSEAQTLIEAVTQQDLFGCLGAKAGTLSVSKLLQLTEEQQRQVLRLWFLQQQIAIPSAVKLKHILSDVLKAGADKLPEVSWGNRVARRYRDDLFIGLKEDIREPSDDISWDFKEPLIIPGVGILTATLTHGLGITSALQSVTVSFQHAGTKILLPGRQHRHYLKNLLQEWAVPPWQRSRIPLLKMEQEVIEVVGYARGQLLQASADEQGWVVTFIHVAA